MAKTSTKKKATHRSCRSSKIEVPAADAAAEITEAPAAETAEKTPKKAE